MNEEIYKILLNGMPVPQFFAFYLASLFGAFVWFLIKTFISVSKRVKSQGKPNRKYFWHNLFKLGISVIVLPWVVIYFPDYGPFIMEALFSFPELETGEHNHLVMEMNAGSAAIIGFMIDIGIRKATEKLINKYMPKK